MTTPSNVWPLKKAAAILMLTMEGYKIKSALLSNFFQRYLCRSRQICVVFLEYDRDFGSKFKKEKIASNWSGPS